MYELLVLAIHKFHIFFLLAVYQALHGSKNHNIINTLDDKQLNLYSPVKQGGEVELLTKTVKFVFCEHYFTSPF